MNGILNNVLKKLWIYCKAYGPAVLWAGVIFLFSAQSSLPGFDVGMADYIFKKFSHMTVYAFLYFLLYRGVNYQQSADKHKMGHQKNWLIPFFLTFAYSTTDEVHQMFTPKRTPSPIDVGFDLIGTSIAFLRIYGYI